MTDDERLMRRALELAGEGRYSTSPNPMVGCVIARDGRIIAEGWHQRTGGPHAEAVALAGCTESPRGATAYVTLEPCAHFGLTPPCADALVDAGISRVVIAIGDPFPQVDGAGIARLRAAGIEVETGLLADEAARQNEKFLHSVRTGRPFVLLKAGMSLDGKLATHTRRSRWITSVASRERSLILREEYDAVLVGSGTVADDDPELTRRLALSTAAAGWLRVVVDTAGAIPHPARVFDGSAPTILYTSAPAACDGVNATVVPMTASDGKLDLESVLDDLGRRGVRSVIAEGGSLVHSDLIERRLWQKMILFVAPLLLGGRAAPPLFDSEAVREVSEGRRLRFDSVEQLGPDLVVTAYP
jgi:diaminohydroxyphosphoribosylaminopyrimidine deaminase / 5-amino-6-(5-phosphoribosylamino)uracil reductase